MEELNDSDTSALIWLSRMCMGASRKEVELSELDESQQAVIEQTTVILPFLDDEVPALSLADGRYIFLLRGLPGAWYSR